MNSHGLRAYRKTTVITADPGRLIIMCYEGAINQLKIAKMKYERKEYEAKYKALTNAMDYIDELLCSLDFEKGGDIARHLQTLYNYMTNRLLQADVNRNIEGVDEVIGILTELLSAWKEIVAGQSRKFQPESIEFNEERPRQAVRM
ncbi:MAG: flagellar export chaperone FliS [Desulfobacteraceae bacterium]|nr:MAG: flagellar export chaperone FliS [Desulfobacteraceae bacterium]